MPSFRVNKDKNYTVMSNYHLKDKELSLKAKGLLSVMLSLPDTWDYSIRGLVSILKEGKDGVASTLKELEKHGYLIRTKVVDEKGKFNGYDYDVYEKPVSLKPHPENPCPEMPYTDNPHPGKPSTENPLQSITKESNTKESNTNLLNINQSIYSLDDVKKQIEYEYHKDRKIDEIVLLMREVLNSTEEQIKIAGSYKPAQDVKDVFLKLNFFHIEYVLSCLNENKSEIKNMKAYMLACLYNSIMTIDSYYDNRVKQDLGY